ncbi:MAG: hydrogenase expression/formation protein HypE [Bacteroidota bacterium]
MKEKNILSSHGSGGKQTQSLIHDLFLTQFGRAEQFPTDSAIVEVPAGMLAFTTDSFVVTPIFFPGGNIGKLAVCGTVNDLAVSGAKPKWLSCGFILEEGLDIAELEKIVIAMAEEAKKAGVSIVAGDTKVVSKGQCDKIFINTSGIGILDPKNKNISTGADIKIGDKIIINGTLADHGASVAAARNGIHFEPELYSDCACLNGMIETVLSSCPSVRFMRDATRGGLAAVLCELVEKKNYGILLQETAIPVSEPVKGLCELLGFDPLLMANEGKVLMIVSDEDAPKALKALQSHEFGKNASVIGEITETQAGRVILKTEIGGSRIVEMPAGEQLPRIC